MIPRPQNALAVMVCILILFWYNRFCQDLAKLSRVRDAELRETVVKSLLFGDPLLAKDSSLDVLLSTKQWQEDQGIQDFNGLRNMLITIDHSSWPERTAAAETGATAGQGNGMGMAPYKGCRRVLWFMGILAGNAAGQQEWWDYVRVALWSAFHNAPSLIPIIIVDGPPSDSTAWLERHGAHVIFHDLSFQSSLKRSLDEGHISAGVYASRGALLRLDIPLVYRQVLAKFGGAPTVEKDFYLYTDNDVMFLRDVDSCSFSRVSVASMGTELLKGVAGDAGVFWVNASAFSQYRAQLIKLGDQRHWNFPANAQGLLLEFFQTRDLPVSCMPDILNWKGYWGHSSNATIVHFYGPKPERCLPCFLSQPKTYQQCDCVDAYTKLFGSAPDKGRFYRDLMQIYQKIKWEADNK